MKEKIHKFQQNGMYILLDINSGAVHVIDKMIYDIMDTFDGTNDAAVVSRLQGTYPAAELKESLGELHALIEAKQLFAPDIDVPPTFAEEGIVKSMCLMVAHDCNLRCKYCFGDTGEYGGDRELMSKEVGEAAIEYIIEHSGPRKHCEVDFFGGEPLVNMPVVRHVTAYVRRREKETGKIFKLTLTTNGLLLNDENIKFLNDNNVSLVLSLDGRKEVHDRFRKDYAGHGSYDAIVPKFQEFVKKRGDKNYYMRGTYTHYNTDFTNDIFHMADLGFTELSMEPVVSKPGEPSALTEEDLPILKEQYEILAKEMIKRDREGRGFTFYHYMIDLTGGPCIYKRISGCGSGTEYMAVTPWGDLYPCHQFVGDPKYLMGDIWKGVTNTAVRDEVKHCNAYARKECKDCWAKLYCSGGCAANSYHATGSITGVYEYGCELFKKRVECAIMIKVAENQELAAQGIEVPIELGGTCNACADGEACE